MKRRKKELPVYGTYGQNVLVTRVHHHLKGKRYRVGFTPEGRMFEEVPDQNRVNIDRMNDDFTPPWVD